MLSARLGDLVEARRYCLEALPIFKAEGVESEAYAALELATAASKVEAVTLLAWVHWLELPRPAEPAVPAGSAFAVRLLPTTESRAAVCALVAVSRSVSTEEVLKVPRASKMKPPAFHVIGMSARSRATKATSHERV